MEAYEYVRASSSSRAPDLSLSIISNKLSSSRFEGGSPSTLTSRRIWSTNSFLASLPIEGIVGILVLYILYLPYLRPGLISLPSPLRSHESSIVSGFSLCRSRK